MAPNYEAIGEDMDLALSDGGGGLYKPLATCERPPLKECEKHHTPLAPNELTTPRTTSLVIDLVAAENVDGEGGSEEAAAASGGTSAASVKELEKEDADERIIANVFPPISTSTKSPIFT